MKKINLDIQKFASPSSISGQDTYWKLEAKFTDVPGTSVNNTSNFVVNLNLYLLKTATASGTVKASCIVSGNGITTVSETFTKSMTGWKTVGTAISLGKIEIPQIPHNGDGTKTVHVKIQMTLIDNPSLLPGLFGNIVVEQNITLERIYRYSTLLAVENFDEDSDYTALDYVSYSGSGASDTLSVRATNVSGELVLDDSSWTEDQINLTNKTQYTQIQSIREYLSQYLSGVDSVQAVFTLVSQIGTQSLTTSAIVYMNKKYVFSKYKETEDVNFLWQKKYYTYNSSTTKYDDLIGYAVFSTATTSGNFVANTRYFEKISDDTGTTYQLLVEGEDYNVGEAITTLYPNGVYLEDQSIASYKTSHGISKIFERDDHYNICQHILHNKTEKKYRMAINGVADPAGPPLQVYNAYDSEDSTNREDLFFYRPGDRVSITGYTTGALISNSNATIRWTVVLPKRLDFVKAPKIVDSSKNSTTCMMYVRCSLPGNGYVHASGDGGGFRGNASGTSWTTANIVKYPSSGPCNKIKLEFIRDGKWKMWANNTPGAGSTVTNNQPLVAEVSNLLLEFPTE